MRNNADSLAFSSYAGWMTSLVTCRGLPLSGLPVADSSGGTEGNYLVSVHELSIQLWKNFDTPRVSVQKKIDDLRIPVLKCTKRQLGILRKESVVQGFRATIVSIRDAEKVCDALQYSREKRGLTKHPLKTKDSSERKKRRREEEWLLKMNARMCSASSDMLVVEKETSKLVDECALIGVAPTPTLSQEIIRIDDSASSLKFEEVEEELANQLPFEKGIEHEVVKNLNQFTPPSSSRLQSRDLEALDLFVGSSQNMATLRSRLEKTSTGTGSLQGGKPVSRSATTLARGRIRVHPLPIPTSPMKRPRLHSVTMPSKVANCTNHILSPSAVSLGVPPEREHSPSETCKVVRVKKAERFLYWSDDDEADHTKLPSNDDVILVRVENSRCRQSSSTANVGESNALLHKQARPHHKPHHKRVVKLRHFAHTTSPTASASASPGKQLPLGSTHSQRRTRHCRRKPLWVSISRSDLSSNASSPIGQPPYNDRQPSTTFVHPLNQHNSAPEPSYLSSLYKKGPPLLTKCRPKPTLSSFATMKRARALSPVQANLKPAKRLKPNTSENSVVTRAGNTPPQTSSGHDRGVSSEKASIQALGGRELEPRGSGGMLSFVGTTPSSSSVGGARAGKPLPHSNGRGLGQELVDEGQMSVTNSFSPSANMGQKSGGVDTRHRGAKVVSESESQRLGTFKFEELFDYCPPKLVVRDGDLCPEHSLSVSGMEKSQLNSLSQTHPFWNWTPGQPVNKVPAASVKSSKRKQKSKASNMS